MSSEEKSCPSTTFVGEQIVHCKREVGHPSVHLGRIPDSQIDGVTSEALHQWTNSESVDASAPVDDLPVWYSVLPIGKRVRIETTYGVTWDGAQLTGAVVDDHEQPTALRLDYRDALEHVQHVLLPWSRVNAIEWHDEDGM